MAVTTRRQAAEEVAPPSTSMVNKEEEKPVMDSSDDDGTDSQTSCASSEGEAANTAMLDFRNATEWLNFIAGLLLLAVAGPPVGIVVFAAMVWEAVDRCFDGGFIDSGRELSGFLFAKFVPWLRHSTQKFNERFVKRPDDAYMMNCIFAYGVLVPCMFFGCAYWAIQSDRHMTPLWVLFLYHVVRIGPYFMNFAYVYTLCHKEGHSYAGLFSKPYNDSIMLRNVFNYWIGMFYGVLPATFAYGHSINHHRYNNGPSDVISTADKPRDNFFNWVCYLPRFMLYAANISTIHQFATERNWKIVTKVFLGSLWFFAFLMLVGHFVGWTFAVAYVFFPFFEANILLAAVNWSWHAFLDPANPENEYVQSVTILDGCINVLNEDSHVVHHQTPGAHWTDHPNLQTKGWDKYIDNRASVFRTTHAFEIFGMSVARDYDAMAKKFVDIKGEKEGCPMSHSEKVDLIKERLRACWWGPRVESSTSEVVIDVKKTN